MTYNPAKSIKVFNIYLVKVKVNGMTAWSLCRVTTIYQDSVEIVLTSDPEQTKLVVKKEDLFSDQKDHQTIIPTECII